MTLTTRRDFVKTAALTPLALAPLGLRSESTGVVQPQPAGSVLTAGRSGCITFGGLRLLWWRAPGQQQSHLRRVPSPRQTIGVLVLEGRAMIGGGVKTAEILLPGFQARPVFELAPPHRP